MNDLREYVDAGGPISYVPSLAEVCIDKLASTSRRS
jgi:hypothetical protein